MTDEETEWRRCCSVASMLQTSWCRSVTCSEVWGWGGTDSQVIFTNIQQVYNAHRIPSILDVILFLKMKSHFKHSSCITIIQCILPLLVNEVQCESLILYVRRGFLASCANPVLVQTFVEGKKGKESRKDCFLFFCFCSKSSKPIFPRNPNPFENNESFRICRLL